jgi:hypothetical protein
MTLTMMQTVLIREAHALQACHGAFDDIVCSLHEDVNVDHHSRPCSGGGDVARNEVRWMNALAINGILFGGGRRTTLSGPAIGRWPWMDCLVHCLETNYVKGDGYGSGGGDQGNTVGSKSRNGFPVVLRCILSAASFGKARMQ